MRASLEIFAFLRSKTPNSFNVWIGMIGTYKFRLHVCRLLCSHNVRILCAVSLLMLMTWHFKRFTNCRQHAHIEIIYVCDRAERARKIFVFLHSKPAISFILFVGTSDILLVWYDIQSWNIWGMIIQAIPPPKILGGGGIYPPIPPGSTPMGLTLTWIYESSLLWTDRGMSSSRKAVKTLLDL